MNMLVFSARAYEKNAFEQVLPNFPTVTVDYTDATFNLQNISLAKGYDAVCIFVNHVCDKQMVAQLAKNGVKNILLRCAGFNNVDLDAVKLHGLGIARVPQYSPYAVAEHALGLLMCLNRKIHKAHLRVRENNFVLNGLEGSDIYGKNIGIIGFGKIGQIMASIFSGFKVQTYVFDPVVSADFIREKGCIPASLDEIA